MNLTDTHCHLNLPQFDEDRQLVLQRAAESGVQRMLVPAMDWESCLAILEFVQTKPELFAALGFHPTEAQGWSEGSHEKLAALLDQNRHNPKIVAIGEIGLDYYWIKETEKRAWQSQVLKQQLRLAQEMNKPVVVHMREQGDAWFGEASIELLNILEEWQQSLAAQAHPLALRPGVLHSFNGTLETAGRAISHNFMIGVTGPVTYKNADQKREIIRAIPLDKLLIETDSPYLAPVPHRGQRNEPAYVARIADKIAEIHSKDPAEIAEITTSNAAKLFAWGE
jgi:TatD DNase family protein